MGKKALCSLLVTLSLPISAFASDDMSVPVSIQSAFFMKILSYDRSLQSKNEIKIGVLSGKQQDAIISDFTGKKVGNVSLSVSKVSVSNSDNVDVLYVPPGNKDNIDTISKKTQNKSILTITAVPSYVEGGLSIGLGLKLKFKTRNYS
ncbi:MAG: YfiR/HmsC family protein [Candidatus Sericytochromatia bacterium]